MNLKKLDIMLSELDPQEDSELIAYYRRKRVELLEEILLSVKEKDPKLSDLTVEDIDAVNSLSEKRSKVDFELTKIQVGSFVVHGEKIIVTPNILADLKKHMLNKYAKILILKDLTLYQIELLYLENQDLSPNENDYCIAKVLNGSKTGKTKYFKEEELQESELYLV